MSHQDLWNTCQEINKYIGAFAVMGVMWRLVPQLLERDRWHSPRAIHLMLWFLWIAAIIANATIVIIRQDIPPTYASGVRLLLNVAAIALCLWWPHPIKFEPIEVGYRRAP